METGIKPGEGNRAFYRTLSIATLVAVFASLLILAYPFNGDQALHQVVARMINDGATLYVDTWDVKQPGIYYFHLWAGQALAFNEVGVHALEAIYMIGASVAIAFGLRRFVDRSWVAGLYPVFGAAWYFAAAGPTDLTQVEILISPLIAGIAVALAHTDGPRGRLLALAAGLMTGVIVVFKTLAVVVPAAVVGVSLLLARRAATSFREWLTGTLTPLALGAALPVAGVAAWVLVSGNAEAAWYTWVEYPLELSSSIDRPIGRLIESAGRIGAHYALIVVLALVRVLRPREGDHVPYLLLMTGLVASVPYVLIQYWWSYLFFVVVAPLAAIAVMGLDVLIGIRRKSVALALVLAVGLSFFPLRLAALKAARLPSLVTGESLSDYRSGFGHYAVEAESAEAVSIDEGETVWVMGNPLIHRILDVGMAIPTNGWSAEVWPDDVWERVLADLNTAQVDHIFIAEYFDDEIEERPAFEDWLMRSYRVAHSDDRGRWFELRDS